MKYKELQLDKKIAQILSLVPQQFPFRFIDRLIEADENRIVGQYQFKPDEWFYQGHFPGNPVTPGVILVESMAQIGLVAFGLHLTLLEDLDPCLIEALFHETHVEFLKPVLPGNLVTIKAEKISWRLGKLESKIDLYLPGDILAATGTMAGLGTRTHDAEI